MAKPFSAAVRTWRLSGNGNEGMTRVAFIKFDISDLATLERAILRLYVEFVDQLENSDFPLRRNGNGMVRVGSDMGKRSRYGRHIHHCP